jgi:hypothetical protein
VPIADPARRSARHPVVSDEIKYPVRPLDHVALARLYQTIRAQ